MLPGGYPMTNDPNKSSKRDVAPRYSDPFSALRAEMDSLFDSFIGGLPAFSGMFGSSGGRGFALIPHMDITETDKEIVVEAELPGLDEKDVSLALQDGVLTIRGEKKHERNEEKENYRMMERRYGSFQRSVQLPDTVDEDKVEATFNNGVLKVSLPKRPEASGKQRTIPIKKG
jgi:HSP20 family protein